MIAKRLIIRGSFYKKVGLSLWRSWSCEGFEETVEEGVGMSPCVCSLQPFKGDVLSCVGDFDGLVVGIWR